VLILPYDCGRLLAYDFGSLLQAMVLQNESSVTLESVTAVVGVIAARVQESSDEGGDALRLRIREKY
jgi:hypothetical protein